MIQQEIYAIKYTQWTIEQSHEIHGYINWKCQLLQKAEFQ